MQQLYPNSMQYDVRLTVNVAVGEHAVHVQSMTAL
jgi:hypothetical protein